MTYGELKRKVLELMDRATVAGSDISPAYNGQSDVLRRIPGLLNDAVMRIRDRIPLEDQVLLGKTQGEVVGPYRRYALPEDFWLFKTGYVWRVEQDKLLPWKDWQRCGDAILLPPGQFWVRYYKYPALLPADPAMTTRGAKSAMCSISPPITPPPCSPPGRIASPTPC